MGLEEYLYEYVVSNNLENSYKGIIKTDDQDVVANYSSITNIITYNPSRIEYQIDLDTYNNHLSSLISKLEYKEFYYKYVLLHELRHMYQNKLVTDKFDNSVLKRLIINNSVSNSEGLVYHLLHNMFIEERDANFNTLNLLEKEYNNSSIIKSIQLIDINLLLENYSLNKSPIILLNELNTIMNYCNIVQTNEIIMNERKYSLYEKLYYGFPITEKELNLLNEIKISLSFNGLNNQDVKTLIKNYKKGE